MLGNKDTRSVHNLTLKQLQLFVEYLTGKIQYFMENIENKLLKIAPLSTMQSPTRLGLTRGS